MFRTSFFYRAKAPHLVLGVAANATELQIKEKYKELARRLHPDMPGGNERKFQELNAAYSILKLRAQARSSKGSMTGKTKARTMNYYRGEDDFGDDEDGGGGNKSKYKSYVDEEEAAELRAQERAAEELRRMQSQTFAQMMWTMSTWEIIVSLAGLLASILLSLHRRLDLVVGDQIDFTDVAANEAREPRLKFQEPVVLNEDQKFVRDVYREVTSDRTKTSHTKYYHLKDILMIYDIERAQERKVEAKPVAAELVDEDRLLEESPIVARIDATALVTPYHNISYKIKEKVAERQWLHVDIGPAIVLMLEGCRRVPKNDPAAYRITTIEYKSNDDQSAVANTLAGSFLSQSSTGVANVVAKPRKNNNNNNNDDVDDDQDDNNNNNVDNDDSSSPSIVSSSSSSSATATAAAAAAAGGGGGGGYGGFDYSNKNSENISDISNPKGGNVPRVVVTIVNDKFRPNEGRCQRIVISGYDRFQPDLIAKRRAMLRTGEVKEEDLESLKLVFPVRNEGIQAPPKEKDERRVLYEPPIKIERHKL